jgi:type IV pilus assembly protein PilV
MTMRSQKRTSGGSVLLEALVGILIFSIGILALVAMQAESIRNTTEAKYRNDASYLANQIIGRMWADRVKTDGTSNLGSYSHYAGGTTPCSPTGSASTYAGVTDWLADVAATLPNAPANKQQIAIGANNLVTVMLCWQTGSTSHNLVVSAQIQG